MPSTIINDVNLYYECYGKGDPLMLIAGLASDSQSWEPIVADLAKQYLVILPDNRGAGRTLPQEAKTSIQHIADDCIALLEHLKLPSATLLGHSMGGLVTMDCAIRYPKYVSKLILAATSAVNSERNGALFHDWNSYLKAGMEPEQWFRNMFYWIFSKRFFENKEALNAAVQFAVNYPYPQSKIAFENQIKAIEEFNCQQKLPAIKAETLIICGKEDLLFPFEESIEILQAIPRTSISIIEDAAHSIHMEKPESFVECISGFLSNRKAIASFDV